MSDLTPPFAFPPQKVPVDKHAMKLPSVGMLGWKHAFGGFLGTIATSAESASNCQLTRVPVSKLALRKSMMTGAASVFGALDPFLGGFAPGAGTDVTDAEAES